MRYQAALITDIIYYLNNLVNLTNCYLQELLLDDGSGYYRGYSQPSNLFRQLISFAHLAYNRASSPCFAFNIEINNNIDRSHTFAGMA